MQPLVLAPNSFPHFYRGGSRIAAFRRLRLAASTENMPEDWVGSTTMRHGSDGQGLSALPDGRLLRDAIAADPQSWLGPDHVQSFGDDLGVLVKLLDAGQRLVVHAHPDRRFAATHLGCAHGKTEAWIVLSTAADVGQVHLGFRDEVSRDTLRRWVGEQDTEAMLAALVTVDVRAGDTVFVPAGMPHAIGAGVFIAELQEPTDFSILMEWAGFDVDPASGHLGLGYDLALDAVDRTACDEARLAALVGPTAPSSSSQSLLVGAADPFFRALRVRAGATLSAGVAVVLAISGTGELRGSFGSLVIASGDSVLVPYASGAVTVEGDVELLWCMPAAASSVNVA